MEQRTGQAIPNFSPETAIRISSHESESIREGEMNQGIVNVKLLIVQNGGLISSANEKGNLSQ